MIWTVQNNFGPKKRQGINLTNFVSTSKKLHNPPKINVDNRINIFESVAKIRFRVTFSWIQWCRKFWKYGGWGVVMWCLINCPPPWYWPATILWRGRGVVRPPAPSFSCNLFLNSWGPLIWFCWERFLKKTNFIYSLASLLPKVIVYKSCGEPSLFKLNKTS